jgi:O-antigen/teichoic acid export membrane protein
MDWKRHARNIGWQLGEQVFRIISGLFVGLWVARYLGPTHYGLLGFAMVASNAGLVFARVGLDTPLVHDLVRFADKEHLVASTALSIRVIMALGVAAVGVLLTGLSDKSSIYLAVSLMSIVALSTDVADCVFQARQASAMISSFKLGQAVVSALLRVAMVLFEVDPEAFVLLILADAALLAGVYILMWSRAFPDKTFFRFDRYVAWALLRGSGWMYLNSIAVLVYSRIDQFLVKRHLGSEAAGNYYAAVRLTEMYQLFPATIINAIFPSLSRAGALIKGKAMSLYGLTIWLGVVYAVTASLLADFLIGFLYGEQYKYASAVLQIHCWIGVVVGVSWVSGKLNVVEAYQRISFVNTAATGLLSIPICFFLVVEFGVLGAAYAALLSSLLSGVLLGLVWPQTRYRLALAFRGFILAPLHLHSIVGNILIRRFR